MITIKINTENAAFTDDEGRETARILHNLADRIEDSQKLDERDGFLLRDINGNTVGDFDISEG